MKKTKKHWLDMGLKILGASGEKKLTIDYLCKNLQVTKGSFYHHFSSRKIYIYEMLKYWSQKYTDEIIEVISELNSTTQKAHELINKILVMPQKAEIAIRIWAAQNEEVLHFQQQVDEARMTFLQKHLFNITKDRKRSQQDARVVYTCYIGCQHVLPNITQYEYIDILNHLLTIVGLPPYDEKEVTK